MKYSTSFLALCFALSTITWDASTSAKQPQKTKLRPTAAVGTGVSMNFDKDKPGDMAKGFVISETAGNGKTATWKVLKYNKAPSGQNAFGITRNENYGHTFNLAIATGSNLKDVDVSVKVKAVGGKEDQGGGPIWRAKDGDNYYVARWNPLEDNFRLYFVKDGRRRQLKSARVHLDTSKFHTVRATMRGDKIECFLDGKKLLETTDATFKDSGMVGLWVKADGKTIFDDLVATTAK